VRAGKVLPIGGVREKTIAAQRAGIKHIVLPEDNRRDFEELPAHIRRGLRVHYASDYADVYDAAFGTEKGEPAIVHKKAAKRAPKKKSEISAEEAAKAAEEGEHAPLPLVTEEKARRERQDRKKRIAKRKAAAAQKAPRAVPDAIKKKIRSRAPPKKKGSKPAAM
jgi:hypothetical protein